MKYEVECSRPVGRSVDRIHDLNEHQAELADHFFIGDASTVLVTCIAFLPLPDEGGSGWGIGIDSIGEAFG